MTSRKRSVRVARALGALLGLNVLLASAIEAPPTATPQNPPQQTAPAKVEVTATDEAAFYERLQYVAHKRNLVGLGASDDVLKSLASGSMQAAIGSLSSLSVAGDRNATIALVRVQHWCSRMASAQPTDAQSQLQRLAPTLSQQRLARVAGVFVAERAYQQRAKQGCSNAPFDYAGIESRLRAAAEAGHEPPALSINSHGFVAATAREAVDVSYGPFATMMDRIGRERGWPPMTPQTFEAARSRRGANFVGTPAEVVEKILFQHEIFGHQRFLLQLSVGTIPHDRLMRAIELFGTEVAPVVRDEVARRTAAATVASHS